MERQPTRSKRAREPRRFDRTQLRLAGHGRTVHRDYAAHVFRWNFTANYVNAVRSLQTCTDYISTFRETANEEETTHLMKLERYVEEIFLKYGWIQRHIKQGLKILDVGCGQDQPLVYVLGAKMSTVPKLYVGLDMNNILKKTNVRWAKIHDKFDFTSNADWVKKTYGEFDLVTCFEVIEHMQVPDGRRLLAAIHEVLSPEGRLFLSTPVFNGLAAANHLHEFTIPELRELLQAQGFKVLKRFGTFASKPDIYGKLTPDQRATYDQLEIWYGGEVLACLYAPLYPDASRNNLWVCKKTGPD